MAEIETNNISQNVPNAPAQRLVRVAISQGDTNGVGYELILKTFADTQMLEMCTPIIYGHIKVANYHKRVLNLNTPLNVISSAEDAVDGKVNFVNCSDDDIKVEFGVQSAEAGHAAFMALEQAIADYKEGLVDTLVTAPINKASIQSSNFRFVGHTEYLQDRVGNEGSEPLMILCNSVMCVALVTTHMPISQVASAITQEAIEKKAQLLFEALQKDFNVSSPRIAVLALNPHAGDGGILGTEEQTVISPAIKHLSEEGVPCYGPYAADGFFGSGMFKHFDGILAMYHDQGLVAFKALSMNEGVNFTAGLSLVRTSPDHGTAYDIAGRGLALPDSFRQAIYAATDIFKKRNIYLESHANPLPKIYQDRRER